MNDRIKCEICGAQIHAVQIHLRQVHPEVSLEEYRQKYPEAPLLSESAKRLIEERKQRDKEEGSKVEMAGASVVPIPVRHASSSVITSRKEPLHELFKLGKIKSALNARGDGIPITVFDRTGPDADLVPDLDPAYIFNVELLKTVLFGIEQHIPTYLWGHSGTGKSTMFKNICAATGRPFMRVQHTANTEESHILGQWTVKGGETVFELGPLPLAMKHGWFYLADEYDFAFPSVLSVYQPVLEGEPLIIKEAPPELRVIHPSEHFGFGATGNTNGTGDETGLYQGTNMQNAANYERFGIVEKVEYMAKNQEIAIVVNQTGAVKEDAEKLVDFATQIREAYEGNKMTMTVSPRSLIFAAKIGRARNNFKVGLAHAFINRLTKVDREVANGICQRVFG